MDVSLQTIALWVVPVVFAITLHEAAHGYVAKSFGDRTAEMLGRITLNPLKHIDPVGTILVPGVLILAAKLGGPQFVFGWAKPVPVNFGNLRNPKRDMLWVAAAGPGANFAMAVLWALLLKVAAPGGVSESAHLLLMAKIGVSVNLVLMALNLLPVPPLDGGRIAVSLLPVHAAHAYARIEPYGLFIIVGLLAFGRPRQPDGARCCASANGLLQALLGLLSRSRLTTTIASMFADRVLSGMRPTGRMHIGHYHGALKNWVRLQEEYECLFFAADWHALTTHYDATGNDRRERLGHVRRLARGRHRSDARDAVHPVARARARRADAAARHDRAGRLARARADVQGPAAEARRPRPVEFRLPRLSGDA